MPKQTRVKKLENLIQNQGMITMGMFDESFEEIAEKLTEAMGTGLDAASDAVTSAVGGSLPRLAPRVRIELGGIFSEIRGELASDWPKNPALFRQYVADPAFDKGIEIVESYDLHRPRLTEELTDEALASYVFLLKGGDKEATRMFRELSEWQKELPRPPWAR